MAMVVGVGFEPTYATRADLQSAAFNHSATPPVCHFHRTLFACKATTILRDKKAQLICQQRSRLMTPKSAKKQHSAKNPHRNRQKPIPNRGDVNAGGGRRNANKRPSNHGQTATATGKTAPKPHKMAISSGDAMRFLPRLRIRIAGFSSFMSPPTVPTRWKPKLAILTSSVKMISQRRK